MSQLPAVHALTAKSEDLFAYLLDQTKVHSSPETQSIILRLQKDTYINEGKLFKNINGNSKLYSSLSERPQLILSAHHLTGHGGVHKTLLQLQDNYYWECMSANVYDITSACHECQIHRPIRKSQAIITLNLGMPGILSVLML